jgi:hypothetical protein
MRRDLIDFKGVISNGLEVYIWLHADTNHSRKPLKDKHIVCSTAPQWG